MIERDVGELRAARDVADGKGAAVGRAQPRVDGDPVRADRDPGGAETEGFELGRRPAATSRCEPRIRSPVASFTARPDPSRATESIVTRDRSTIPSHARRSTRRLTSSGSSRGKSGPRSSTVTCAPRRRCACAISMPIAPPPMTIRCRGNTRFAKMVSLVRYGSSVEPGDRRNDRTRACRDHKPPRPDFDIAGAHRARAGEARFGAQHGDAEPFKPLGGVVGRDVGNHPLNAVADRGEIDLWPHVIDAKQRSSAPEIREPGRGEQRL